MNITHVEQKELYFGFAVYATYFHDLTLVWYGTLLRAECRKFGSKMNQWPIIIIIIIMMSGDCQR